MPLHRVRLLPSGHDFLAAESQSLLNAGLESGLNLRYRCEGGTCGQCLARLYSGQIKSIRHSDFVLSAQQKANNYFVSCCHSAASDLEVEMPEITNVDEIEQQHIQARVYRLQQLSPRVMALTIKTPRSQTFHFLAGQRARVIIDDGIDREKYLAGCPCDGLRLEFHVRWQPGDLFSDTVFNRLRRNERIDVVGPYGRQVLDEDSTRPLIFIAFDTGFAAIKSMLEHVIGQELSQPIHLYWITPAEQRPYANNYCRSLRDALDNFRYFPLPLTENSLVRFSAVLDQVIGNEAQLANGEVYAVVPDAFAAVVADRLISAGLPGSRCRVEAQSGL